jgi:hypothetical protein
VRSMKPPSASSQRGISSAASPLLDWVTVLSQS